MCIPQDLLLMALIEEGLNNRCLDLSNRNITRVRIIPENGGLELTTINVNGGRQIRVIEANALVGLKVLKLNNNNITSIHTNTFSCDFNLRNLRILDISNNNLRNNINKNLFSDLEHLEELNLNHNFISNLNSETYIGLTNLKDLNLSDNRLVDLDPNTFRPNLESLVSLNLERNRLRSICGFLTPTLEKLNLSFNEIKECDGEFRRLESLDSLHLDNNKLEQILSNLFPKSNRLQYLHLNENEINEIADDALFECVNLYEINMANNKLNQLNDKLFRLARNVNISFRSLRSINLENNQLVQIDRNLFSSLYNLEILNLSRNKIEEFKDGCFDDLGKLKILQLEYNKFDPDDIDQRLFLNLHSILLLTLFDDTIIQTVSSFYKAANDYPYFRSENIQNIIGLFRNYDRINQPRQPDIPQPDISLVKPYKADWETFLKQFSMT